jgi:hypothetical protein
MLLRFDIGRVDGVCVCVCVCVCEVLFCSAVAVAVDLLLVSLADDDVQGGAS